jgi:hypothetical protein
LTLAIPAHGEFFLNLFELIVVVCLFVPAAKAFATQQSEENCQPKYFIERIDLMGNRRIETGTLLARISSRPGDPYSVEVVRRDLVAHGRQFSRVKPTYQKIFFTEYGDSGVQHR